MKTSLSIKQTILLTVLITVATVAVYLAVFNPIASSAQDAVDGTGQTQEVTRQRGGYTEEEKAEKLAEKVASGELTQEEADAIASGEGHSKDGQKRGGKGSEGHKRGGDSEGRTQLTEEEKAAMLAEKVASGELTQEQADAIASGEGHSKDGQKRGGKGQGRGGQKDAVDSVSFDA